MSEELSWLDLALLLERTICILLPQEELYKFTCLHVSMLPHL
jgi:hypothetical protein